VVNGKTRMNMPGEISFWALDKKPAIPAGRLRIKNGMNAIKLIKGKGFGTVKN
jgi:hypothetical protein